jgi:signal transduction histidine kinase
MDATAVEHAVENLINNAMDASPAGEQVVVTTRCEDHRWAIAVQDHGVGVAPDQKMRLFDPFYTTKQDQGGTGLGLSLAHGIVADHGGAIRIDSQPGAGATFTIELPCCAPREAALAASDGSTG